MKRGQNLPRIYNFTIRMIFIVIYFTRFSFFSGRFASFSYFSTTITISTTVEVKAKYQQQTKKQGTCSPADGLLGPVTASHLPSTLHLLRLKEAEGIGPREP